MKFLIGFLCLSGFAAASWVGEAAQFRKAPELAFTLPQEGQKLLSQYRGKVVALEFILTTCMHCQAASKVMTRMQQEFGNRDFQALDLAINGLDEGRNPQTADALVQSFQSNFQVGFPVGWVRRDDMSSFLQFSVMERSVVPQLVLIDRAGYIHYQTPPMGEEKSMQEETIRERIKELLAMPYAPAKAVGKAHATAKKSS
ncbi:MAG: TlpA family protein disulfide reductase [Bryobacteraceae bacterium]